MPPLSADVIVIGAGLSGLSAAVKLYECGIKVLVLEARDRVGGKTWSRELAGGIVDMGAAWINDTNQSRMFALAKRFGLETIVQNTKGDVVVRDLGGGGERFPYGSAMTKSAEPGGADNMIMIRDLFETLCHKTDIRDPLSSIKDLGVDYDSMSMADLVRHHGGGQTALETVSIWTRAMLGLEPREVSALYFLEYCESGGGIMQMRSDERDGGQFLRIADGTQSFSKKLAGLLPAGSVVLGQPVLSISQSRNGVTVATSRQTFTSRHVIVSIPSILYKTLHFEPPLPAAKQKLTDHTIHGYITKVFVAYKEPWWRTYGFCGLTQSLNGLIGVTRDTSNDAAGHYSLLGFVSGDPGRAWSRLSPEDRKAAVLSHFRYLFTDLIPKEKLPGGKVPEPIGYIEQIWWNEEFSQGCPCPAMPPRLMTEVGKELRTPHGRVSFAGTETAFEWRGYMEGAVRSGERAAEEVSNKLNQEQKPKL